MGIKTTIATITGIGIGSFLTYQVIVNNFDEKAADIYDNAKSGVEETVEKTNDSMQKTFNPTLGDRIERMQYNLKESSSDHDKYLGQLKSLTIQGFTAVYHTQPDSAQAMLQEMVKTYATETTRRKILEDFFR